MDLSVLDAKIARTVFRDTENEKRWDMTRAPGFMNERGPDVMSQIEVAGFKLNNESEFSFMMKDFVTDEVLFDTSKRSLILSDKYLEIGFVLPTQILFGLGQHNSEFLLSEGNWSMFNRDRNESIVANGKGNQQTSGTHPFLMAKTNNNKFIGMLFYNSNAQEINIRFSTTGKSLITYRTVGGMLDIYYFLASSADEVIQNYNNLIGKPSMLPFWALGFHQSSLQYNITDDLRTVVKDYGDNGFLLDSIWVDLSYNFNDYTSPINEGKYSEISFYFYRHPSIN